MLYHQVYPKQEVLLQFCRLLIDFKRRCNAFPELTISELCLFLLLGQIGRFKIVEHWWESVGLERILRP